VEPPAWVTFDCYGTLIEFDLGAVTVRALGPRAAGLDLDAFLGAFEELRYEAVLGPYRPYREVLRGSLADAMRRFGLPYREEDGDALVAAVPTFGPFPDVPPALARLRRRCRLAIISNTDDDLIAASLRAIGVPFDRVVTAEQARAYKPDPAIFRHALAALGCAAGDVLHVAAGFRYDIVPAHDLGWARVWVNRRGQAGDPAYGPYRELPDLAGLPALLGLA
jgi:2-haloacid dehalogenase